MKAIDSDLTPDEIKLILQNTSVDIGDPGFDNETGFGRVDAYAALVETQALLADLDGDGVIGINDFPLLLAVWGPCKTGPGCQGDIDLDGTVGIIDFLYMLANWG
jgi:hypothetical protein